MEILFYMDCSSKKVECFYSIDIKIKCSYENLGLESSFTGRHGAKSLLDIYFSVTYSLQCTGMRVPYCHTVRHMDLVLLIVGGVLV